jgi:GMP synthase (glutamine-hydrolysing)
MTALKFLLAEGNTRERNAAAIEAGGRTGTECFREILDAVAPGSVIDIVNPADIDAAMPSGAGIADYHGFMMSGSALNIPGGEDDPRVTRQVDLAKAVFAAGVPFWGSCWGLQVAVAAAGGTVSASPLGCEMAVARKVQLNDAGRANPLYAGKAAVFDAPAVHVDEVTALPPGATLLASNGFSKVQGATFTHGAGTFWGTQYHPEFDLADMSVLVHRYTERLVNQGFFATPEEAEAHAERLQALHDAPARKDLAWLLGIDGDILDSAVRWREIANWVEFAVKPRTAD